MGGCGLAGIFTLQTSFLHQPNRMGEQLFVPLSSPPPLCIHTRSSASVHWQNAVCPAPSVTPGCPEGYETRVNFFPWCCTDRTAVMSRLPAEASRGCSLASLQGRCTAPAVGTARGLPCAPEHGSGARERYPTKLAPVTSSDTAWLCCGLGSRGWKQPPGSLWQRDGCCGC